MTVTVKMAEQTQNMCSGCPVHCCTLAIYPTSYDITRILIVGEKKFDSFIGYVEAAEDDPLAFKAWDKMIKFKIDKKQDGLCIFFDSSKKLYCTIEEYKPGVCLAYPMELRDGEVALRDEAICPKENLKRADFNKMSKQVLEDALWEWDRYAEFVHDWNGFAKGNEKPEEFLKFAASEMEAEMNPIRVHLRHVRRSILAKLKNLNRREDHEGKIE